MEFFRPQTCLASMNSCIFSLSALSASASLASAAVVNFSTVVGTYDQGGNYTVGQSINGNALDGFGWGVFGDQTNNQTAVYTASAAFNANNLQVAIPQFLGTNHYANDFRVSYTTDASPTLGGSWTELAPTIARAANGLTLGALGSNRFGPSGSSVDGTTNYVLMAQGNFVGVTGMRLELFNSAGNLGASANGNMVVSEFQVTTNAEINLALAAPITASAATWPGNPAVFVNDGRSGTFSHPGQDSQVNFSYTIDLQGVNALTRLELVDRTACCPDRLTNYRVEILDDMMASVWTANLAGTPGEGTDTVVAGDGVGTFAGRYVRLTNNSGAQYNPQIAELRAFGSPIPEPSIPLLLGLGFLGCFRRRR